MSHPNSSRQTGTHGRLPRALVRKKNRRASKARRPGFAPRYKEIFRQLYGLGINKHYYLCWCCGRKTTHGVMHRDHALERCEAIRLSSRAADNFAVTIPSCPTCNTRRIGRKVGFRAAVLKCAKRYEQYDRRRFRKRVKILRQYANYSLVDAAEARLTDLVRKTMPRTGVRAKQGGKKVSSATARGLFP